MTIYNDLVTALETAVDGMTTAGGYNYDYDNVNEQKPANKTYPNVILHVGTEEARDPEGEVINAYSLDAPVMFEVMVDTTVSSVREALQQVIEDFQRLFEDQDNTLRCLGLTIGDYGGSQKEYTHVRARPGKVTIQYEIFYRLKRTDPSLTT